MGQEKKKRENTQIFGIYENKIVGWRKKMLVVRLGTLKFWLSTQLVSAMYSYSVATNKLCLRNLSRILEQCLT